MQFMLISDNHDTAVGMRLAGIDGVIVSTSEEVDAALTMAINDSDIGVVLITKRLSAMCRNTVDEIKLRMSRPLIVEVPDRHIEEGDSVSSITDYVREAIGVKI